MDPLLFRAVLRFWWFDACQINLISNLLPASQYSLNRKNFGQWPKISNTSFPHPFFLFLFFLSVCFTKYTCTWRNGKQCRPWSDCSFRSSLIWVCTVCICHFVRKVGVQNFRTCTIMHLFRFTLTLSKHCTFRRNQPSFNGVVYNGKMAEHILVWHLYTEGSLWTNPSYCL